MGRAARAVAEAFPGPTLAAVRGSFTGLVGRGLQLTDMRAGGVRRASGDWMLDLAAASPGAAVVEGGPTVLAFLGEIYNADALRRALDAPAEIGAAELLHRAQLAWGDTFPARANFQGVLAVWSGDRLVLHRDGSAAYNLYYSVLPGGGLAFATHLDALVAMPGVPRRLSRPALHEYLRMLDITAPATIYAGVHALPVGERLHWRHGEAHLQDAEVEPAAPAPALDEALDRLWALLCESTAARIGDLDRPASFLSGGVDSSLLCAAAAQVHPGTTAVTVGFDGAPYDETPAAARIAAHLGLPHVVLRFQRSDYLSATERFNRSAEQPFADPAIPPTLLSFEHCAGRFDAVLDGSGADESVGLMPPRHVRIAVEYGDLLPPALRRALVRALHLVPGPRGYTPILDFEHPAELMIRWRGFRRAEIEALCGEPVDLRGTRFYRTHARFPRRAHFERFSALEDGMPNDRLHQSAAMTGLRVRYPYCEARLDAFIRAQPLDYRHRPGAPKRILRELLARHVPREIWDMPKHGFDFPLEAFLRGEDHALVRRWLDLDRWRQWNILAPERVADYARRFIAGEPDLVFRVWSLVVLAAWLEAHEVAAG